MWGNRIDRLRAELGDLWTEIGGRAKLFAFSDEVAEAAGPAELPHPSGSTDLAAAIRKANGLFPSALRDQLRLPRRRRRPPGGGGDAGRDQRPLRRRRRGRLRLRVRGEAGGGGGGQVIRRDLGKGQPILADMRAILALAPPMAPETPPVDTPRNDEAPGSTPGPFSSRRPIRPKRINNGHILIGLARS